MALHPDVEQFLEDSRRLSDAMGAIKAAAFDDLRVRRSAPDEPDVMPEIDGWGAMTDLYLGEGIVDRYGPAQLEALVMSGLRECYSVVRDRRSQAAHDAAPEFDFSEWFDPAPNDPAPNDATPDESSDGEAWR